jgi:hypothetical protein
MRIGVIYAFSARPEWGRFQYPSDRAVYVRLGGGGSQGENLSDLHEQEFCYGRGHRVR